MKKEYDSSLDTWTDANKSTPHSEGIYDCLYGNGKVYKRKYIPPKSTHNWATLISSKKGVWLSCRDNGVRKQPEWWKKPGDEAINSETKTVNLGKMFAENNLIKRFTLELYEDQNNNPEFTFTILGIDDLGAVTGSGPDLETAVKKGLKAFRENVQRVRISHEAKLNKIKNALSNTVFS